MVDILEFVADKDQITTEEIVSQFGFNPTSALIPRQPNAIFANLLSSVIWRRMVAIRTGRIQRNINNESEEHFEVPEAGDGQ